jgi:hypothetical protein
MTSIVDVVQFFVTMFQMTCAYVTIAFWKFRGRKNARPLMKMVLWPEEKQESERAN